MYFRFLFAYFATSHRRVNPEVVVVAAVGPQAVAVYRAARA